MSSAFHAHLTFHLRGGQLVPALGPIDVRRARPSLFARYEKLTALRYDFPIVISADGGARALSAIVDDLLAAVGAVDDATRMTHHVLRLERRIRELAAAGTVGSLSNLWDRAAAQLTAEDPSEGLKASLQLARRSLSVDGPVVDCDRALPRRLIAHAWRAVHDAQARRFHADIDRLIQALSDILESDCAVTARGRSADRLRSSVGPLDQATFDFQTLSHVLTRVAPPATISDRRRERIESALAVLSDQRFFSTSADAYSWTFTTCGAAVEAYQARRPQMAALSAAIEIARLERDGRYQEEVHDRLFDGTRFSQNDGLESPGFPDYLVTIDAEELGPAEQATLMEALEARLPIKVLVQTNDILDASSLGPTHFGFGFRSRQIANTAIGLHDVFVLQAPASLLLRSSASLRAGLERRGPAVFNIFSGATWPAAGLPPYLVAAAALEARAFPAFVYDPDAGPDWASRFSLSGNPQPAADWPVHQFTYEDRDHQSVTADLAFTLVDFVIADERFSSHFTPIDRARWHERMVPVSEALSRARPGRWDLIPYLTVVDDAHRLGRVLVDDVLLREAQRCLEMWHSLQELGGVNNSHARRLLETQIAERAPGVSAQTTSVSAERSPSGPNDQRQPPTTSVSAQTPGDPYIETPRCSTCNECTQINNRMFAYNENKQAYIADASAGTFRHLVEAAESCQVSIIHPGVPRDPGEPGLDELVKRAEAFQ